ncbi:uncharacterized protein ACO6RY_13210 [Pungitius sinensis]
MRRRPVVSPGVQEECITQKAVCWGQKGDSMFPCSRSRLHVSSNAAVFPPKWSGCHFLTTLLQAVPHLNCSENFKC